MSTNLVKVILAALLVLSLVGAGWYVADLRGDKAALKLQVDQYVADIDQMKRFAIRDKTAIKQAQDALAAAQAKARTATKGVQDAYKNDPAARDWADVPIPPSLQQSLK